MTFFENLNPARSRVMTMEGMLDNANRVLNQAAKVDRKGSLSPLVKRAKGIILISLVESAIGIGGAIGSGVILTKDAETGEWGPPCACGLTATGWGFGMGAQVKDIIMFAFDDKTVASFASKLGLKMNVGTSLTFGTYGIDAGANLSVSRSGAGYGANVAGYGAGGTVSIVFSRGAFVTASVSGSVIGPREYVNHTFYDDSKITAYKILLEGEGAAILKKKRENADNAKSIELLDKIYEKLALFAKGETDEVIPGPVPEDVPEEASTFIDELAADAIQKLEAAKKVAQEEQKKLEEGKDTQVDLKAESLASDLANTLEM